MTNTGYIQFNFHSISSAKISGAIPKGFHLNMLTIKLFQNKLHDGKSLERQKHRK